MQPSKNEKPSTTMKKGVVYVELSQLEEEKGLTEPSCLEMIRDYAKKNNIEITETFIETQSTKLIFPSEYLIMLCYIHTSKDSYALLSRNFKEITGNYLCIKGLRELKNVDEHHLVEDNQVSYHPFNYLKISLYDLFGLSHSQTKMEGK